MINQGGSKIRPESFYDHYWSYSGRCAIPHWLPTCDDRQLIWSVAGGRPIAWTSDLCSGGEVYCPWKILLIHESGTLLQELHKVLTHDLNMSRVLRRCKVKSDAPAPPSPSGFPAPVNLNERVFCHCGPVSWTEPGQPKPDYLRFLTAFF